MSDATRETCLPLALAIALADDEVKQRVAALLRDLAASRLGLVDVFAEPAAAANDDPEGE